MIWLLLALSLSLAQDFRAPFLDAHYGYYYPTAYFDHAGRDWACGGIRYGGHTGSDYGVGGFAGMDAGRTIVAVADGTVTYTHDGEFDRCTSGRCAGGGGCGNYVQVRHADGKLLSYCHMKKWTVRVRAGDRVRCGQALGSVGSSGWSTGPHLHLGVKTASGARVDPFDGPCSGPPSYWTSQGSHGGRPGRGCHVRDADGDGYTADRDCNDADRSIYPGAPEVCDDGRDQDCDGSDRRSTLVFVDGDGDGWGGSERRICRARRPGEVTRRGDCDDGRDTVYPDAEELCDGLDNNCDGRADEGSPTELGEPPPALAARIVDRSLPAVVPAGEAVPMWAIVENVGTESWPARGVWLVAGESPLRDDSWAAWDVPAVVEGDVAPGEQGVLRGVLRGGRPVGDRVHATFFLQSADGAPVRCPAGELDVAVQIVPAGDPSTPPSARSGTGTLRACQSSPGPGGWLGVFLALFALAWRRR